jgi:tetratricopeptide (TPR) repeat protein
MGEAPAAVAAKADPAAQAVAGTPSETAKVSPNAVTNWQAFFKAPPSAQETAVLALKLEHWPQDAGVAQLRAQARAEMAIGRFSAAEVSFRQALRANSDDLEAMLELSALYLRQQKLSEAFALLTQAKEAISSSDSVTQTVLFKYRYTLALAYIGRGERDKGHKILSDLIGLDKTFTPAYASLASSYLAIGRTSVAEFVLKRGLDRVHENSCLMNLMGVIAQRSQQVETARSWFDKALVVSPAYAPAMVNRAVLNAGNQEFSAAEEDLVQALKADPLNVDALVALGVVQKRQGNIIGAKASFTKAVDSDPDNAYGRYNLGALMADDLKKPNEALRLFYEVLQTTAASTELKDLARSYINDLAPLGARY